MTTSFRSLSARVPWQRVLALLEITPASQALPARTGCPLCQETRLTIFQDYTTQGQWYSCSYCEFAGSGLELLQRVWQLSFEATLVKLIRLGTLTLPAGLSAQECATRYREEVQAFSDSRQRLWQDFRSPSAYRQYAAGMLATLGLRPSVDAEWFETTVLEILAAAPKMQIESYFAPTTILVENERWKSRQPSKQRLFKGQRWENILLIPYYDVPGRVATYVAVGREGREPQDVVRGYALRHLGASKPDAGLAFHPQLPGLRGPVVGVGDWRLYLQLQLKHYRLSGDCLPLVGWLGGDKLRTRRSWKMLGGRQIVIWAQQLTADALRQAIQTDGLLSHAGPVSLRDDALQTYLQEFEVPDLLAQIRRRALPWPQRLDQEADQQPDHVLEDLFLQLNLPAPRLHWVLRRCHPRTRERVLGLLRYSAPPPSVLVGRTRIEEREVGWVACHGSGNDELVADAKLRIDYAVWHEREQQTFYSGRVLYGGEELPFCAPQVQLERHGFRWLRDFLLKNRRGMLSYSPHWVQQLVSLACLFHKPRFESALSQVGWDQQRSAFVLPRFLLESGGQVQPHTVPPIFSDPPASMLEPPATLPAELLSNLTHDTPTNALFWSAWCQVTSNILAPAFGRPTRGLAVRGQGAAALMAYAAHTCGCLTLNYATGRGGTAIINALKKEHAHSWPVLLPCDGSLVGKTAATWFTQPAPRNLIAPVDELQELLLQLTGEWHTLGDNHRRTLPDNWLEPLRALLPAYLQHVLTRSLELPLQHDELVLDICRDVGRWLTGLGYGDTPCVRARRLIRAARPTGRADAWGRLLSRLILAGKLRFSPRPSETRTALWEHRRPHGLFVPKAALQWAFSRTSLPHVDAAAISRHLTAAGILIDERECFSLPGWLVKLSWWQNLHDQETNQRRRLLKLHTGTD